MALRKQFQQLLADLKAEVGASTVVGVGVDSEPAMKRAINREYQALARGYNWPHLRTITDRIPISAGQRYYDFPAAVNYERVEEFGIWWGNLVTPVDRGVRFEQYNAFDPERNVRSDPVLAWDTVWAGTKVQIEFWPLPASNNQAFQVIGYVPTPELVNDDDLCLIDSEVIVQFAAARILAKKGSKDAENAKSEAQEVLAMLKRNNGPSKRFRMGTDATPTRPKTITISVRG